MFMYRNSRRWIRVIAVWMIVSFVFSAIPLPAQVPPGPGVMVSPSPTGNPMPTPGLAASGDKLISLNFRDAPLDQVLQFYTELTGRTLLKSPGVPNATISLRGTTRLTEKEALIAIESVLSMNKITLVPMGDKFLKVVAPESARQEGMPIGVKVPEKGFPETDQLVSQIVPLKYIEITEAQGIITSFARYGKIQPLERANALLITDTASNLQRIMEILSYLDQPAETRVETRIYEIKYAEAAKIAGRLNELVAEAQSKEEKPRVAVPGAQAPNPPGVIRAPRAESAESGPAAVEAELAERGIVQGKVKIIADDRTNILIVIARPSNFPFFDKIVSILDRPVEPDIVVRVMALEYAKAEDIASILNEFVGVAKAETKTPSAGTTAPAGTAGATEGAQARQVDEVLRDLAAQRAEATDRLRAAISEEKTKIGQLSPNTKILADKRTNSLLLMGTKGDLAALEDVIDKLDTMLAQVMIEAVILQVNLSKNLNYGIDWLQRSMTAYADVAKGPNGGVLVRQPVFSFGGGLLTSQSQAINAGDSVSRATALNSGLSYYTTIFDLNIDAVIKMVAGSSDARVLQTPIILTTDNTEAKIMVGEQRPVVTSTSLSTAGQQTSAYEYRNIGVDLTVTPRINPQRYVVMEISQTVDDVGDLVKIDNNEVPVILKREMKASVAVPSRSTIVLGGLVLSGKRKSRSKIPILGDLPVMGALFRADSRSDTRSELMILLTPYVLMTPEEARAETVRVHANSETSKGLWYRGWSDSDMANLTPRQIEEQKKAVKKGKMDENDKKGDNEPAFPESVPVSVIIPSENMATQDVKGVSEKVAKPPVEAVPAKQESPITLRETVPSAGTKEEPTPPEAKLETAPDSSKVSQPAGESEIQKPMATDSSNEPVRP